MKSDTFNAITKTLAAPTTRRQAFRRIGGLFAGGMLGGGALAALSPQVALAGGGNSNCSDFCNATFPPGPDRGQCKSDAAHGTGLCYTCGPNRMGGALAICCPADSNGQCTSYASATCCSSGTICTGGTCVSSCSGTTLANGTCAQDCYATFTCSCGFCDNDIGNPYSYFCSNEQGSGLACTSDLNCPRGEFCSGFTHTCETAVIC